MDTRSVFADFFTPTKQALVDNPDRLQAVARSELMYSDPDPLFDELCSLAAETMGTPIALVTILDDQHQFFKARLGLDSTQTPVTWSFCQHTLPLPNEVLVVGDALNDERVRFSPLVTGEPHIRAYMGAPVTNKQGQVLGTLCVIDHQPRTFTLQQEQRLARLAKLVSALIDLQETARAELEDHKRQAAQEVQQLVTLLTHSLDLQAYADVNGIYRYVNQALANAYGLQPEQLVGRHIEDVAGTAAYDQWIREPFKIALAGQQGKFRRQAQFPALGHRWMDVDLFPVWNEHAVVKGVVLRGRDVHDMVLAQETVERRLINQQQFVNVLAHDVREPLRTIRGFVSLALEEGGAALPEDIRAFLRRAQGGGQRLSVLIDDLLVFLRADGEAIRTEPVNLQSLTESVLEDLGELMREHQAVVEHQVEAVDVLGARVWLRVLLQNLVVNGIKYAQPGVAPVVKITAQVKDDQVLLDICDNGMGISAEDRSKLFCPFVRLAPGQAISGSGLGLALCQKVADLHGTRIDVASLPGGGSRFSVPLPLAARQPRTQPG